MKKIACCILVLYGMSNLLWAQILIQPVSGRYVGLGAYSAEHIDVYASQRNAASLAMLKQAAVSAYAEKRFMLKDLSFVAASMALPTHSGSFALHGVYFGSAVSKQSQLQLAYGRTLSNKLEAGVGFHFHQLAQAGPYGKSSAVTGSAGLILHLTPKVHAGLHVYNPLRAAWSRAKDERLPSQYSLGLGYDASEQFFMGAELVQEETQGVNVNAGMQYRLATQFFLKAGVATQSHLYFGGVGFLLKDMRLDMAVSYHPQLGISPGLMLLYEWGKTKAAQKQP